MGFLEDIRDAGVVGAGGAGFPTQVKLDAKVEWLLVNAAECEPLLHTDKHIMNAYADEVVMASALTADHVGADKVRFAIKGVNEREIAAVSAAIARRGDGRIEVFRLQNYYPAGDEQMIVADATGRIVPPSGIPLEVGCVVTNVATLLGIHDAAAGRPVTHKFLTVTGEVCRPMVLRVPVGISFRALLDCCGGVRIPDYMIVSGGPMMGTLSAKEVLDDLLVTKTTSGVIVIPARNNFEARLHDMSVQQMLNRAKAACIQCTFCTDLCPRNLIGHRLRPHMVMRRMAAMDFGGETTPDAVLQEALICCECGICETFACPMALSPRQVNKYVKRELRGTKYERPADPPVLSPVREYRKIAPRKIMARMGLSGLYERKVEGFAELSADIVRIPLRQHIGAPAVPVVSVGDRVACGQRIASAEGHVSANVHASIDGIVRRIDDAIEIGEG